MNFNFAWCVGPLVVRSELPDQVRDSLRLSRIAPYPRLLELGRSRAHPIRLDVGSCCELDTLTASGDVIEAVFVVGTDLRKLIADGYPRDSVIATDVVPGGCVSA